MSAKWMMRLAMCGIGSNYTRVFDRDTGSTDVYAVAAGVTSNLKRKPHQRTVAFSGSAVDSMASAIIQTVSPAAVVDVEGRSRCMESSGNKGEMDPRLMDRVRNSQRAQDNKTKC
jgi:hypothetical protein